MTNFRCRKRTRRRHFSYQRLLIWAFSVTGFENCAAQDPEKVITFSFGPHANSFNLPIISVPKDLMRMSYITDSNNLRKTAIS